MCIRDRVILIPSLSYKKEMMIKGIMLEAIERLEAIPNGYFGQMCIRDRATCSPKKGTLEQTPGAQW